MFKKYIVLKTKALKLSARIINAEFQLFLDIDTNRYLMFYFYVYTGQIFFFVIPVRCAKHSFITAPIIPIIYNTYYIEEVNLESIKSIRASYSGRFNDNLKSSLKGLLSSKLISLTFQYHFTNKWS